MHNLCIPNFIEVFQCQRLLLDHEANDLLQLLDVLRLVKVVAQNDCQYIIGRYPLLVHSINQSITERLDKRQDLGPGNMFQKLLPKILRHILVPVFRPDAWLLGS